LFGCGSSEMKDLGAVPEVPSFSFSHFFIFKAQNYVLVQTLTERVV